MKNFPASLVRDVLFGVAMLAVACVPSAVTQERVVFPFNTISSTAPPYGGIAVDGKGDLYTMANSYCPSGTTSIPCFNLNALLPPTVAGGQWAVVQPLSYLYDSEPGTVNAGLVRDSRGNFYGTASGGANNSGYVFQIVPTASNIIYGGWTFNVLYNFQAQNDAAAPTSSLVIDSAGNLYGASYYNYLGNGTVFQLKPPTTKGGAWTESVIYTSTSPTGVILDGHGNLFGMTLAGGTSGSGGVFQLSPPSSTGGSWTAQTLYTFPANEAAAKPNKQRTANGDVLPPKGSEVPSENTLAIDADGSLYGTRPFGGASNYGYVFKLSPTSGDAWSLSTLYSFAGSPDGAYPAGGVTLAANGVLYGTTFNGGPQTNYGGNLGTVFQLTPPKTAGDAWTEKVLRNFTGGFDGLNPTSSLLINARGIFGVTSGGGGGFVGGSAGAVFQIEP